MAAAGLKAEDFASDIVEIWPENLYSFEVFNRLRGHWRYRPCGMGPGIPEAIDCGAIPVVLRLKRVPRDEWDQVVEDIEVMEQQALLTMRQE